MSLLLLFHAPPVTGDPFQGSLGATMQAAISAFHPSGVVLEAGVSLTLSTEKHLASPTSWEGALTATIATNVVQGPGPKLQQGVVASHTVMIANRTEQIVLEQALHATITTTINIPSLMMPGSLSMLGVGI